MLLWKGCRYHKLSLTVSSHIPDLIYVDSYSQSKHGSRCQISWMFELGNLEEYLSCFAWHGTQKRFFQYVGKFVG